MSDNSRKIDDLIDIRIEKLNNFINQGIDPFPHNFDLKDSVSSIVENEKTININDNNLYSTAGRIVSIRNMGKAAFINIQSDDDRLQLYMSNKNLDMDESSYNVYLHNLDIGDILGVEGEMFYTKTKEFTLRCRKVSLLSKNIRPLPNLKEKEGEAFNSFDDIESRYRYRHLDFITNPANKNIFIQRHKIINALREYLNKLDYIEAETPVLQPIYGGANARPFTTHHFTLDEKLYLRIAVELYLKRLIIGGFNKVYEISKNFRNEGMDRTHNPEFTMLELYKAYSDVYDIMDITENLIKFAAKAVDMNTITCNNISFDIDTKFKRITLAELFDNKFKEKDLLFNEKKLQKIGGKLDVDEGLNYGQLVDKIFSLTIEPDLIEPTFVLDYPKEISPLSKIKRGCKDIVERFELFICGMEIANAFTELNDPIEQRKRFKMQEKLKAKGDEEAQVIDEDFLSAMEVGMPPTGGVGIGIDRIVMILSNQKSIKDVILFPAMRKK